MAVFLAAFPGITPRTATGGGMNKRFGQLLSFLKDPQAHPHPAITLDHRLYVKRGTLRALKVKECSQEAIEIMESGMFHQGLLKGNRRTRNIAIENLEMFVLEAAAAIFLAKRQLSGSLWIYYLDSEGQPLVTEHLVITAFFKLKDALDHVKDILLNPPLQRNPLVRQDRFTTIEHQLGISFLDVEPNLVSSDDLNKIKGSLLSDAINKIREQTSFDLANELINVFIRHVPKAPNYLIGSHIFKFIRVRQDTSLKGVNIPSRDALRQEVKKQINLTVMPTIQ